MTDIQISVNEDTLAKLFSTSDGMGELITQLLNKVLEAQAEEQLGAGRYERSTERRGYRNGTRPRTIATRVGTLTLQVPQVREGEFSTEIFARYQRSEQALVLALMEMVINGVSTRKVSKITEELCGTSFPKSTVSALCARLDPLVEAWRNRTLGTFRVVQVDALILKIRYEQTVMSHSALLAIGIDSDSKRHILGLSIGDSESEASWDDFFKSLKRRNLKGVAIVTSDNHSGLVKALRKNFQKVRWQRCQTHFIKNILDHTRNTHKANVKELAHQVLHAKDKQKAINALDLVLPEIEKLAPKAAKCLEDGFEDATAVLDLPEQYHQKLRSTNSVERLNEEIRRRERVIRIFPNEKSAIRLIGALLMEKHEQWSTGKKYLDMEKLEQWVTIQEQQASKVHQIRDQ